MSESNQTTFAKVPEDDLDNIVISVGAISKNEGSTSNMQIKRRVSNSVLIKDESGNVKAERRTSDVGIAVKRRLSAGSLPSIIPVTLPDVPMMMGAEDALERTGGKGAAGSFSEHMHPIEVIGENYQTHIDYVNVANSRGLSTAKAEEIYNELGPNVLTPPPKVPLWLLFLLQFTNLLMVLLLIVSLLCIILYIINTANPINLYLGVLLFIAVFITCYETFSQEAKSDSLMEKFRAMVPEQASVIRDGVMKPTPATDLVIGDIIRLKSGDKVPADCRVIQNLSMKVLSTKL